MLHSPANLIPIDTPERWVQHDVHIISSRPREHKRLPSFSGLSINDPAQYCSVPNAPANDPPGRWFDLTPFTLCETGESSLGKSMIDLNTEPVDNLAFLKAEKYSLAEKSRRNTKTNILYGETALPPNILHGVTQRPLMNYNLR